MSDKLDLVIPNTRFIPQPYGGVRSSTDLNNFMDETTNDIYSLIDFINTRLVPILNGLPLSEYTDEINALINGLSSVTVFVDPLVDTDSLHSDYYYHSEDPTRSCTIKETLDALITDFKTLQTSVDNITTTLNEEEEDIDISGVVDELRDIRSSVRDIITVLRSLKFYTDWERIHALTVLADPDYTYAPVQTLLGYAPAVKFSGSTVNNLYVNFTIPRHIDPDQGIYCHFVYCMGGDAPSPSEIKLKIDFEYQTVADGDNVLTKTPVSKTITVDTPSTSSTRGSYTGDTFAITGASVMDLINIRFRRDVSVANNNTNDLYILDLSFFGKRLESPQVTI